MTVILCACYYVRNGKSASARALFACMQGSVASLCPGPVVMIIRLWGVGSLVNCLLIAATLSVKNEAKVSGGRGLSRVLKVEKSFRVSVVL